MFQLIQNFVSLKAGKGLGKYGKKNGRNFEQRTAALIHSTNKM